MSFVRYMFGCLHILCFELWAVMFPLLVILFLFVYGVWLVVHGYGFMLVWF